MLKIKILGPGCPNCEQVEAAAKKVVASFAVEAEIEKVTDPADIRSYNVLATPGLVINEKLVVAGRIPSEAEVSSWVANALVGV
jgi:small redox-active disulfide protein 2